MGKEKHDIMQSYQHQELWCWVFWEEIKAKYESAGPGLLSTGKKSKESRHNKLINYRQCDSFKNDITKPGVSFMEEQNKSVKTEVIATKKGNNAKNYNIGSNVVRYSTSN